jgi:hypothetical membrane protein
LRISFLNDISAIIYCLEFAMDNGKSLLHQNTAMAGLLFFLAGSVILMGIITAEIFYPSGYSTSESEISDLGATRPPGSISYQPSASIFNATMVIGGLLILAASFFLFRELKSWIVIFTALLGTGVLGVGLFPGNNPFLHPLFALIAFIAGGLSAIILSMRAPSPFRFVLGFLGLISLIFLFFSAMIIPVLGDGGTERFVAYPVVIWAIGFGGYLIGNEGRPV